MDRFLMFPNWVMWLLIAFVVASLVLGVGLLVAGGLGVARGARKGNPVLVVVSLAALFAGLRILAPREAPPSLPPPPETKAEKDLRLCNQNLLTVVERLDSYYDGHQQRHPARLSELGPVPACPASGKDTFASGYEAVGSHYTLTCAGNHHYPAEQPLFRR